MKYTDFETWKKKEGKQKGECTTCCGFGCYECNGEGVIDLELTPKDYLDACLETAMKYAEYTAKDKWGEICKVLKHCNQQGLSI